MSNCIQSPWPCLAQGERPLSEAILASQEHPVPNSHRDLIYIISLSPGLRPRRLRSSLPCLKMKKLRLREEAHRVLGVPLQTSSPATLSLCCFTTCPHYCLCLECPCHLVLA